MQSYQTVDRDGSTALNTIVHNFKGLGLQSCFDVIFASPDRIKTKKKPHVTVSRMRVEVCEFKREFRVYFSRKRFPETKVEVIRLIRK